MSLFYNSFLTIDNISMSIALFKACAEASTIKKIVFASTASLYGENPTPWSEEMPAYPIEPYSWQKLSIEYAAKVWSVRYSLPTVSLRFFQIYGENQRPDTALAKFLKSKAEGIPITLTETTAQSTFRTGQRDFIYVKDVASAVCEAADSDEVRRGEILNVGTGEVHTMEEIAEAIGGEIVFIPQRKYEVERHEANMKKTKELLDWEPKTKVIDWINGLKYKTK